MVTSRGAFFLGLSLIICVAMLIYGPQIGKFRYLTVPTNQGLFILDTKTQMMNVCTDKNCRTVPHEASNAMMPGVQTTYGQIQMAPVNSLGVIENQSNMMGGFTTCGNGMCLMPMQAQQQQSQTQPVIQINPPKPAAPEILEMVEPRRPAMTASPIMQPNVVVERPRPASMPMMMAQRPIAPAMPTSTGPADQRVANDMAQLQETEQALLGR